MDIKSTVASSTVARPQTAAPRKPDSAQDTSSTQSNQGAVSVSVAGTSRQTGATEGVNDNLSREDALALANAVGEELSNLDSETGIVSNPALLEDAARGV